MSVGHVTRTLNDESRGGRQLTVEVWYPAARAGTSPTRYELLPGIAFDSPAATEAAPPAPGRCPLVVWSHGRTGLRHNYTMLCEGLSRRGFVVVSADHPGDTLFDWLTGDNVDDETNERQRLGDVSYLIDVMTNGFDATVPPSMIDPEAIFVGGHSYGGLTALVTAAGIHGVEADSRVRAIAGAQAYTRTLGADVIDRIRVPALLLVGLGDRTTPPSTDAEPVWSRLQSRDSRHRRVDLPDGGHQACSDFAFYMEMLPSIPDVPRLVVDYLDSIAAESPAGYRDTWRATLEMQTGAIADFFTEHR